MHKLNSGVHAFCKDTNGIKDIIKEGKCPHKSSLGGLSSTTA